MADNYEAYTYGVPVLSHTAWSCSLHAALSSSDDKYVTRICSSRAGCVLGRLLATRPVDTLRWSVAPVFLALCRLHTASEDQESRRCRRHVLPCRCAGSMVPTISVIFYSNYFAVLIIHYQTQTNWLAKIDRSKRQFYLINLVVFDELLLEWFPT